MIRVRQWRTVMVKCVSFTTIFWLLTRTYITKFPAFEEELSSKTTPNINITAKPTNTRTCCYNFPLQKLEEKFTEEFFIKQGRSDKAAANYWIREAYNDWQQVLSSLIDATNSSGDEYCEAQWKQTVLNAVGGGFFYLQIFLTTLAMTNNTYKPNYSFRFVPFQSGIPWILLLGDSISRGTWVETQNLYTPKGLASIQGAPTNCRGLPNYQTEHLESWLGDCRWDVVQFNIGMHHKYGLAEYQAGLKDVVGRIQKHSPSAKVVFALTTPSPFDCNAKWPDRKTCVNYDRFHKAGRVSQLNQAARTALATK
jgi:hypothetical protein